MKMNKVYDYDGDLIGYEFNGYYLMKHYTWGNSYSWIINQTGEYVYCHCEFSRAYDRGEVIPVGNFKEGKAKLMELAQ